jgi:hypothetical protein
MARAVLGGIFAAAEWWSDQQTMSRSDFVDYLDRLMWPGLAATGIDRLTEPVDLSHIARLIGGLELADDAPASTD